MADVSRPRNDKDQGSLSSDEDILEAGDESDEDDEFDDDDLDDEDDEEEDEEAES
jgi:hypothetical protein